MAYSSLKHKLDIMKLEHEHQLHLLEMNQEVELNQLKKTCTHAYDDGTSAKVFKGVQWDYYYACGICGTTL